MNSSENSDLPSELLSACLRALESDDVGGAATILREHPGLLERARQITAAGCKPPLAMARSVAMAELLERHGASIDDLAKWWAPGFFLDDFNPDVAEYLVSRGAKLTVHAAAALGLLSRLEAMLDREPELVHARGGDGCRPLHFSRDVRTVALLVERGAEIDARDEDHDSTPAQWRIQRAPEVTRYLIERGAAPDIFMAAGLGDLAMAERVVREQPECTGFRIGNNNGPFPGIGFRGRGGTIYQWTLGFNQTPHEIALKRGHQAVFDLLMAHSSPKARFLVACTLPDRALAQSLLAANAGLLDELDDNDRSLVAKFCWETNIDIDAVRLMLDLGFPVDQPERNHGYTPLHNASWCGDLALVELLIDRGHPVDVADPAYASTPVGWAIYSCIEARRHPEGAFPDVIDLLLRRGGPFPTNRFPTGHKGIDEVLNRHLPPTEP